MTESLLHQAGIATNLPTWDIVLANNSRFNIFCNMIDVHSFDFSWACRLAHILIILNNVEG